MAKDYLKNDTLNQLLDDLVADPERFNDVMDSWNDLLSISNDGFETVMNASNKSLAPAELESAATKTLSSIAKRDHNNKVRADVALLLNRFPHAAMMVEQSGRITASNDFAYASLEVDAGDLIDTLSFSLLESEPLSEAVSLSIKNSSKIETQDFFLKRGFENKTKRAVVFAIVPSHGPKEHDKTALVFLIDSEWHHDCAKMMKQAFELSDAEMAIIGLFMAGNSLRDIAKQRSRSIATVRTQLQTILNKVGAKSQLDLFRIAMGLSQFARDIEPVTKVANRSEREQFDVLRPNGRAVDVMFYGDRSGTPVLYIHSLFNRTLTPTIEKAITANKMHFIVPGKPGYGKTTFPFAEQTMVDCYVEDVRAVLDQMGLDKFSILAMVSGSPFMFALCKAMPERILSASCIGGAVPAPYVRHSNMTSKWTLALASATKVSPQMAMLMSKSGMRLIKTIGVARFLARHNGSSIIDRDIMTRSDVVEEVRTGLDWITMQGLQAALNDITLCFNDWCHLVDGVRIPVTMLQGHHDPHANLDSVQAFAEAYPNIIRLQKFEDGGQSLIFTHTQAVLDTIMCVPEAIQ